MVKTHGREISFAVVLFSFVPQGDLKLQRTTEKLRVQLEAAVPHALPHTRTHDVLARREGDEDPYNTVDERVDQPAGIVALVAEGSLALSSSALAAGVGCATGGQAGHVLVGVAVGLDFIRMVICVQGRKLVSRLSEP